jgi:hypothetical protein
MDVGVWTLVIWGVVIVAMLVFLKICLGHLCGLSCEDLSCVRDKACQPGDALLSGK